MYKKLYESEERRRRNNKHKNRNRNNDDNNDVLPDFDSFDDYIEYTKSDKYNRNQHQKYSVSVDKKTNKKEYKELDYTMDGSVKQLFLNLTKMTTTFDKENTLIDFLPKNIQTDKFGNYFIKIGESKSMFCCHLDVYCKDYKRVYHIIDENIISTDGTTVLGADDKSGMVVMLKMIENNVPGLYYFFRGEEGVTSPSGTWGSRNALKEYSHIFKTYKRCISFDRRGFKSIISTMMYNDCCSNEFVNSLSSEFKKYGMNYESDNTGIWTDSGVFMQIIPECTNLSVGYLSEHTFNETQDIKHLENLCNASIKINWEDLPTKRNPLEMSDKVGNYRYNSYKDYDYDYDYYNRKKNTNRTYYSKDSFKEPIFIFYDVRDLLAEIGYECLNEYDFQETEEMYFSSYHTNDFFAIRIINSEIYMSDELVKKYTCYGNFDNFKKFVDSETGSLSDNDSIQRGEVVIPDKLNKEKNKTFEKIISEYPDISKKIIKYLNKTNSIEIPNELWFNLKKLMSDTMKLKMDYTGKEGYSVDDFVEWTYNNLEKLSNDIKTNGKKQGKFSSYLDDTTDYTDTQVEIFSKLIESERLLVNLVLKDIDIQKSPRVRNVTSDRITESLKKYKINIKEGLKNINPQTFCLFVFDFTDSINEYYNDFPF